MSITAPPPDQQHMIKALLAREWEHYSERPIRLSLALFLLSLLLFCLDPLLPLVASPLQLWAASHFAWRSRWASVWAFARAGGWFVALLLLYTALDGAHIWIIPTITRALQLLWQAHLPGDLSLSPFDRYSLLARSVLLLPLAPALALCYEYIDPRTNGHPEHFRFLTPADPAEKKKPPTTETPVSQPTPPPRATHQPEPTPHTSPPTQRK